MMISAKLVCFLGILVKNFKFTFLGRQKELRAQISTIGQEEINTEPPEKSRVDSDILPWNERDKRIWIRFFENISGFWQTAHQTRFKSVYLSHSMINVRINSGFFLRLGINLLLDNNQNLSSQLLLTAEKSEFKVLNQKANNWGQFRQNSCMKIIQDSWMLSLLSPEHNG